MGRTIKYKQRYVIRFNQNGLLPLYITYYSGLTDEKYNTSKDLNLAKEFNNINKICEYIDKYDLTENYDITICLYEFISNIPVSKKKEIPFKPLHRKMKVEKLISKMKDGI